MRELLNCCVCFEVYGPCECYIEEGSKIRFRTIVEKRVYEKYLGRLSYKSYPAKHPNQGRFVNQERAEHAGKLMANQIIDYYEHCIVDPLTVHIPAEKNRQMLKIVKTFGTFRKKRKYDTPLVFYCPDVYKGPIPSNEIWIPFETSYLEESTKDPKLEYTRMIITLED